MIDYLLRIYDALKGCQYTLEFDVPVELTSRLVAMGRADSLLQLVITFAVKNIIQCKIYPGFIVALAWINLEPCTT